MDRSATVARHQTMNSVTQQLIEYLKFFVEMVSKAGPGRFGLPSLFGPRSLFISPNKSAIAAAVKRFRAAPCRTTGVI